MAEIREITLQPKQIEFLQTPADIGIGGGSAGGGKTYALTCEATRHMNVTDFVSLFLRRTYSEIAKPGGVWDEGMKLYPAQGAVPRMGKGEFLYPGGARIVYGHIQHEKDLDNWKSSQIPLILWDQLETFMERMFFYMGSRNRSTTGVPSYQRATANPEPNWLADFLDWWIADDGYANMDRVGKLRAFVKIGDEIDWADTKDELIDKYLALGYARAEIEPKTVTFIPFTVYDNPILMEKDPGYLASLKALDFIDRERLLGDRIRGGNWRIKAGAGKIWNEAWFETLPYDMIPKHGVQCRYFDTAATAKKYAKDDPDFTAGVMARYWQGKTYYIDSVARQVPPAMFKEFLIGTIVEDANKCREEGIRYMARWEIEPGSASIREAYEIATQLQGIDVKGVRKTEDKLTSWKPMAAQALQGNVILVQGAWNKGWLSHMHGQPDMPHDDIADASAGAYNELVRELYVRKARSTQG